MPVDPPADLPPSLLLMPPVELLMELLMELSVELLMELLMELSVELLMELSYILFWDSLEGDERTRAALNEYCRTIAVEQSSAAELYDLVVETMQGHEDFTLLRPVVEEWTRGKQIAYNEHVVPMDACYKKARATAKAEKTKTQFNKWNAHADQKETREAIKQKQIEFGAYADNTLKMIVSQVSGFMEPGSHLKLFWSGKGDDGLSLSLYRDSATKSDKTARERQTGEVLEYDFGPMLRYSMDVMDELPGINEVVHATTLVTFRRSVEILDPNFQYRDGPDDDNCVIISQLAKQPDGTQTEFKIELLCTRERFYRGLRYVRENCDGTTKKSRHLIRNRVNNMMAASTYRFADFAALVEQRFHRKYTMHINRHIGVAIHAAFKGDEFLVQNARELLGHRNVKSSLAYADMRHVPCIVIVPPPADGSDDDEDEVENTGDQAGEAAAAAPGDEVGEAAAAATAAAEAAAATAAAEDSVTPRKRSHADSHSEEVGAAAALLMLNANKKPCTGDIVRRHTD
ncbi:hypothetical protein JKP88DRAFT_288224 [Tribonema minus]|uniref:Uncharacterized protein n=1 Tax=Tribonema minus TaxID=303371 RepID=A0A835Z561_9STRA|nr:hypothetical protein JKP88DRAFT_288224 [Tribonema minus]